MIFVANFMVPDGFAACARGPFIFVRPGFKDDKALIAHEFVHVSQFWRTFGLHGLLYTFSKDFRLKSEVEAFKEEIAHCPDRLHRSAELLATNYDLGISTDEAIALLIAAD